MPTNIAGAPAGRFEHSSVWTGDEMIVWGGGLDYSTPTPTATGGRYSPAGNTWTPTSLSGAPGARSLHTAVWSGSEMIVWGGRDPSLVFGDGARYDPLSDAWTPVSPSSAPASRHSHTATWTGSEMIVWGGENDMAQHFTGGRYDPAADTWIPTGTGAFVPFERKLHTAVWTGTETIVWGGQRGTGYAGTGARYCPAGSQGATWPGSVGSATVTYAGGMLTLTWDPSCSGAATDYAVYVGTIGDWTSHMPYSCTTGGAMSMIMPAGSGNEYFLIVPLDANAEGSYGIDSEGGERLPSAGACMQAQSLGGCQ